MKPCAEFEDRLLDYEVLAPAERAMVEAHITSCSACRDFLTALAQVDREMSVAFSDLGAPARLAPRVLREVQFGKPSPLPEVLEGIAWLGLLAMAALAMVIFTGASTVAVTAAAAAIFVVAIVLSLRSLRELRS